MESKNIQVLATAEQQPFSYMWDSTVLPLEANVIDDDLDDVDGDFGDDFLMLAEDIDDDASLGLMVDEEEEDGILFPFHPDPPVTPLPEEESDQESHFHEVTPDMMRDVVSMQIDNEKLPDLDELQKQYKMVCRKLAGSIWHAEMTRRWLAHQSHVHGTRSGPDKIFGKAAGFLSGSRATLTDELEVSRRKVWAVIHSPEPTVL